MPGDIDDEDDAYDVMLTDDDLDAEVDERVEELVEQAPVRAPSRSARAGSAEVRRAIELHMERKRMDEALNYLELDFEDDE